MAKNNFKPLFKYFGDMLVVAFGIFLGILVTDWKDQQNLEDDMQKSLNYIHLELCDNIQNLDNAIQYHRMIKRNLDSLMIKFNEEDLMKYYFSQDDFHLSHIKGWWGVNLPGFDDIAFESAKLKGSIQEINIELLTSISSIYKRQDHLQDYGNTIVNKLLDMDSETKTLDVIGNLELILYDYLYSEELLFKKLTIVIDELSYNIRT